MLITNLISLFKENLSLACWLSCKLSCQGSFLLLKERCMKQDASSQEQVLYRVAETLCIQRLAKGSRTLLKQADSVECGKRKTFHFGSVCFLQTRVSYQVSTSQVKFRSKRVDTLFLLDFSFELSGKFGKGSRERWKEGKVYTRCCQLP